MRVEGEISEEVLHSLAWLRTAWLGLGLGLGLTRLGWARLGWAWLGWACFGLT